MSKAANESNTNNQLKNRTILSLILKLILLVAILLFIFLVKNLLWQNNIKSLAAQISKYNFALNSFTQKYHALPGDVQNTAEFGITKENTDGNFDNSITDQFGKIFQSNGEIPKFWLHLSQTEILDNEYDGKENEHSEIRKTFPVSKIGNKIGIIAFSSEEKVFYQIGFKKSDINQIHMTNSALTSKEAFLFDKKIDDGKPYKGKVMAAGGLTPNNLDNNICTNLYEYNLTIKNPSCQLRIEAK